MIPRTFLEVMSLCDGKLRAFCSGGGDDRIILFSANYFEVPYHTVVGQLSDITVLHVCVNVLMSLSCMSVYECIFAFFSYVSLCFSSCMNNIMQERH